MDRGTVVRSMAGRDKGRYYAVTHTDGAAIYIADGKLHHLDHPKRKNPLHLHQTTVRLDEETMAANGRLCKALRERFVENRSQGFVE